MKGYWGKPEATAEAIPDGWFRTGDLARVDEDGYFFIVDRKKDLIIRGGYNVYPREIEEVLYEHPAVAEVAVIGIPHDALGEEVGAAVALKPGATATAEELREFVKARVAAYKYPRHVWLVDAAAEGPDRQDPAPRGQPPADALSELVTAAGEARPPGRGPPTSADEPRAALDLLLSDAALGPLRRFRPEHVRRSGSAAGLARRPRTRRPARSAGLAGELGQDRGRPLRRRARTEQDRRFADPAWTDNPLLRRILQAYLAGGAAGRGAGRRRRSRTGATASGSGSSSTTWSRRPRPSNNPLLNPPAWKARDRHRRRCSARARAAARCVRDLATRAAGARRWWTPDAFEVGAQPRRHARARSCCAPTIFELIQYTPQTADACAESRC